MLKFFVENSSGIILKGLGVILILFNSDKNWKIELVVKLSSSSEVDCILEIERNYLITRLFIYDLDHIIFFAPDAMFLKTCRLRILVTYVLWSNFCLQGS